MADSTGHASEERRIAKLSQAELTQVAGKHLADLADHERRTAAERRPTSLPRTRRVGRAIELGLLSVGTTFADAWRWVWNPRRAPGRLLTRVRLLAPWKTFSSWTVVLAAFVAGSIVLGSIFIGEETTAGGILLGLSGSATITLVVLLWNDLFRLPYLARRLRRQVVRRPERILLSNLLARNARPLVEQVALDIVPRTRLYEDLLPGVIARNRKDVQIVVGDAGAGKTTALIAIAQLLAQNGIVPVLVPLLSRRETALIDPALTHFERQVNELTRSDAEAKALWRWLVLRRRVALLIDDIDQVGPDGERGLVMRKMLDEAAESGLSVIVTARPAGVPAGIAASAIDLGELEEGAAIDHVLKRAKDEPSFSRSSQPSRRRIAEWVAEGRFAQAPFYLELLASLAAVGQCPRLPQAGSSAGSSQDAGRVYRKPDGEWAWNHLWVRFRVLEEFYRQTQLGRVRRSLGIESRERRSALSALEDAALGTLVASSLGARMKLAERTIDESTARYRQPLRHAIEDFIDTNDRSDLNVDEEDPEGPPAGSQRPRVSAHEVIDAGERLSILDLRPGDKEASFHHRIMQAYLAARCLVVREHDAADADRAPRRQGANLRDLFEGERDWIAALLDPAHPEKLTAHMTLIFAAMKAQELAEAERQNGKRSGMGERRERGERPGNAGAAGWEAVAQRIVRGLFDGAEAAREGGAQDGSMGGRSRTEMTLATEQSATKTQLSLEVSVDAPSSHATSSRLPKQALLEPLYKPNPESRSDPDDSLMKLTTAAEIARAVPESVGKQEDPTSEPASKATLRHVKAAGEIVSVHEIVHDVHLAPGATRWTKLGAIEALTVPSGGEAAAFTETRGRQRWTRIWEFAHDDDYDVRRAACDALEEHAYESFKTLADEIEALIARAAARSAYGRWLVRPERAEDGRAKDGISSAESVALLHPLSLVAGSPDNSLRDVTDWRRNRDIEALTALGSVLPAIVSGFREDPSIELEDAWPTGITDESDATEQESILVVASSTMAIVARQGRPVQETGESVVERHDRPDLREHRLDYARRAVYALESLVALAFEGNHGDLESAVAQGFRSDALRHAFSPGRSLGPGWVTCNRALVAGPCLDHASFWYARLTLYQALALYAIAGANMQETFDVFARHLHRGGRDRHPFTQRAARFARAAMRRNELNSDRWLAYLWGDEGKDTRQRASQLSHRTAQLLADVTVLLNLNESSPEDRQNAFAQMQTLPYCLSGSSDRSEILGEGCPSRCGWGLCPYKQPPPDEPNAYRGVRRAFCRQQQEIASHHKPPWQRGIHRRKLREFWRKMEMHSRT